MYTVIYVTIIIKLFVYLRYAYIVLIVHSKGHLRGVEEVLREREKDVDTIYTYEYIARLHMMYTYATYIQII